MTVTAFVGDIHGRIDALDGLLAVLARRNVDHCVFLGDYINKGSDSAAVLSRLIALKLTERATLLRGNHETALLDAIDNRDLSVFLKMGGAMTVRSYVGGAVGPDVLSELLATIPQDHIAAIRAMPSSFQSWRVVAQHEPTARPRLGRFRVTAHRPTGELPRIGTRLAEIDTGCGDEGGRLTALLWPSRAYVQVDSSGKPIYGNVG